MTFDSIALSGSHECPCGTVVVFTLAQLTATFVTANPLDLTDRAAHSLALPVCSDCKGQTFLNLNLPTGHPHQSVDVIDRIRARLGSPKVHL
jgi:hypothetical protein